MPSIVQPIPLGDLASYNTKQLLGPRDRLLACEDSLAASDIMPEDAETEVDPSTIRFKDDPRWSALYEAVKAELATGEHVPGGDARKAKRHEAAKAQRSVERNRRR